jgi:hypothetical protein
MRSRFIGLHLLVFVFLCLLAEAQNTSDPSHSAASSKTNSPQEGGTPVYDGDGNIIRRENRPSDPKNPVPKKLPEGVILVRGAVSSSSDSTTPMPEGGKIDGTVYANPYFGISYALPSDWYQKFEGPPPTDQGSYVLAQLRPSSNFKGANKGTVLVSAQDLFFTPLPAANALEMVKYSSNALMKDYKVERQPTEIKIANRSFVRFDYFGPAAGLHWYVLATEIRCHMVQFVFTSLDTKLLEELIQDMNKIKLPAGADVSSGTGGGSVPACVKDYAKGENVIHQVDPVLPDRRFNPIPVRIIIDKQGKVKHVHVISAFPEQARIITTALMQWEFKPYLQNGQPAEVETGFLFGAAPPPSPAPQRKAKSVLRSVSSVSN